MRAALFTTFLLLVSGNPDDDVGYLDLFQDAMDEIEDAQLMMEGDPIPDYLDGAFYHTGPGHWSFLNGLVKTPNAIFGAGKMHKWAFDNGKVTFTAKYPQKLMMTNVNVYLMNKEELGVLTDAPIITMIDPKSMSFRREVALYKNSTGGVPDGASAHPHCAKDGSYIGLSETPTGYMAVYKLHPSSPDVIQEIATMKVPYAAYTHSFGLTNGMKGGDYAVVLRQPIPDGFGFNLSSFSTELFPPLFGNTHAHILPMDNGVSGNKPLTLELDRFFFGHFPNAFSPGPGKITFDVNRQEEIFFARFNFDVQSNKTWRDNWAAMHGNAYSSHTRYEVDLAHPERYTKHYLFPDPEAQCSYGATSKWCEFDLHAFHPDDIGKPYCGFWSQQWFFNSTSFASWGIVRVDLCAEGSPKHKVVAHWYRKNTYPGEPQFVPKPGSTDKTEGTIMFHTYEGDTKLAKLIIADAKTLKTISTAILPVRVPWTIHGNYYSKKQLAAGQCIPSTESQTFV